MVILITIKVIKRRTYGCRDQEYFFLKWAPKALRRNAARSAPRNSATN